MEGIELKLIRQDGSETKIGEEGEAYVKCKYMMRSYLNGGTEVFDRDGFFPIIVGEGLSEINIRLYLRKELADYKIPSLIEFVDNIERTMLGKYVKQGVL